MNAAECSLFLAVNVLLNLNPMVVALNVLKFRHTIFILELLEHTPPSQSTTIFSNALVFLAMYVDCILSIANTIPYYLYYHE